MYAVIAAGGKQYRVSEGTVVRVEKLDVNAHAFELTGPADRRGADVAIGGPYVTGARVTAPCRRTAKPTRSRSTKFRRRKHYLRQKGHRQSLTPK